jgi:anti-sigma regulatory factor (Ser/Thr protein kinase)
VSHVGQPVDVTVQSDGVVRVEVVDRGPGVPMTREAPPDAPSGRGLHIVEHICDRWGVHVVGDGKCVWCEVDMGDR